MPTQPTCVGLIEYRTVAFLRSSPASRRRPLPSSLPLSTPPSLTRTTINSLPTELLHHILRFASDCPTLRRLPNGGPSRYGTLRAAALVRRGWRQMAQELLWEEIEIRREVEAKAFVRASRERGFTTLRVVLSIPDGFDSLQAGSDVIRTGAGVESLRTNVMQFLVVGVLFPLAALKSLQLYGPILYTGVPEFSLFTLSHLALGPRPLARLSLDPALATQLLQPSLTSLSIEVPGGQLSPFLPSLLLPVAPQLLHLTIIIGQSSLGTMSPFLALCTNLEHLETSDSAVLSHILHPIKTWSNPVTAEGFSDAIIHALESDAIAVSKLEQLDFLAISEDVARRFGFRARLEPTCERRGIKLVFSG